MTRRTSPITSNSLSLAEARRIALAAQGLARQRLPAPASRQATRRIVERLGVVQIDSVNVLTRAHTLPVFSRAGPYQIDDLHALAYGGRRRALFEYWGHEASLLPVEMQPLLRWRMARARDGVGIYKSLARFGRERADLIAAVIKEIESRGPLAAAQLTQPSKGTGGWWGWSEGKHAMEWLFWSGIVTTATRRNTFERVYDLTERVLPQAVVDTPTPPEAEAQRELMRIAARALGVATAACLRDYFRLDLADATARLAELVELGELTPVDVEGWTGPAYLWNGARLPRAATGRALLAPFDPLIWFRRRTEQLFGTRIRLELYTPQEKRTHGYYVLPFLLGERIVARLDLKADRAAGALSVKAAHVEPGTEPADILEPLAEELASMASWLGLPRIKCERKGNLARLLAGEIKRR